MRKLEFTTASHSFGSHDAAILLPGDDTREAFLEAVVQGLGTEVNVTVAGVTMHLAAWQDPDHWEEDWAALGVDDVDALLEGAVTDS